MSTSILNIQGPFTRIVSGPVHPEYLGQVGLAYPLH